MKKLITTQEVIEVCDFCQKKKITGDNPCLACGREACGECIGMRLPTDGEDPLNYFCKECSVKPDVQAGRMYQIGLENDALWKELRGLQLKEDELRDMRSELRHELEEIVWEIRLNKTRSS